MKVLITYTSVGAGHRTAALALYDYFKKYHPEVDTEKIDVLETSGFFFRFFYRNGYSFLVKYAPFLWQFAFWITYFKCLNWFTRPITSKFDRAFTHRFSRLLQEKNADYIVSTHFLPSEIAVTLKRKGKLSAKLITVVTDFGVHPYWISPGTDLYIVASQYAKEQLFLENIEEHQIQVFGIPVHSKFLEVSDKKSLLKKFGLDPDIFTILISTGSFSIGAVEHIVESLHQEVQILVVCANNKTLYRHLSVKKYPHVHVFGFIDNLQELMAVSNIIITKSGGLTIAESLVMDLVPIFITAIPGHEAVNAEVLARYGVGISSHDITFLKNTILDFKRHPHKIQAVKERIARIKKPSAVREIAHVVCQGGLRPCR